MHTQVTIILLTGINLKLTQHQLDSAVFNLRK